MKRLLAAALLSTAAVNANALDFTFTGSLENRNEVAFFDFSLSSLTNNVRAWTDSFQSGVNFDPIIAIWQQSGSDWLQVGQNDDNASVGPGQTSWDAGLSFASLAAGNYRLSVTPFSNFSNGSLLSQGFRFDSRPLTDHGRGDFFRVNLSNVDSASPVSPVPEPETYAMLLAGLGLMVGFARRRKQQA